MLAPHRSTQFLSFMSKSTVQTLELLHLGAVTTARGSLFQCPTGEEPFPDIHKGIINSKKCVCVTVSLQHTLDLFLPPSFLNDYINLFFIEDTSVVIKELKEQYFIQYRWLNIKSIVFRIFVSGNQKVISF